MVLPTAYPRVHSPYSDSANAWMPEGANAIQKCVVGQCNVWVLQWMIGGTCMLADGSLVGS